MSTADEKDGVALAIPINECAAFQFVETPFVSPVIPIKIYSRRYDHDLEGNVITFTLDAGDE